MKTTFKLPTLETFNKMSFKNKAITFLNWAKTKPASKKYNPRSNRDCILAQFAKSLTDKFTSCANEDFSVGTFMNPDFSNVQVFSSELYARDGIEASPIWSVKTNGENKPEDTFGAFVKRLEKYIKKYYGDKSP